MFQDVTDPGLGWIKNSCSKPLIINLTHKSLMF